MIASANSVNRPIGATVLAVIFGLLGVAGILNALIWPLAFYGSSLSVDLPQLPLWRSPVVPILALGYGISALAFAWGLWGLRRWTLRAYIAWIVCLILLTLFFLWRMPSSGKTAAELVDVVFGIVALVALLAAPWLYASKLLQSNER